MFKIKKICGVLLIWAMMLTLIPVQSNAAKKVKLNKSKLSLYVGKSYTLKLKSNKKKIKWSSSRKSIATVSSKGKVKAKKKGTCKITAKVGKKKYVCKVTVKKKLVKNNNDTPEETTKYGSVSGNITYFYNNFRGNVPDTNAKVILLSTSGSGINMPDFSGSSDWALPSKINEYNEYGVYATSVDGFGQYTFNNVKVGEYKIIILSNGTTSGSAFDNKALYAASLSNFAMTYINGNNAKMLGEYVGYRKYKTDSIRVRENQNYAYGYDFGITYI